VPIATAPPRPTDATIGPITRMREPATASPPLHAPASTAPDGSTATADPPGSGQAPAPFFPTLPALAPSGGLSAAGFGLAMSAILGSLLALAAGVAAGRRLSLAPSPWRPLFVVEPLVPPG
jgi:hypothetical protein